MRARATGARVLVLVTLALLLAMCLWASGRGLHYGAGLEVLYGPWYRVWLAVAIVAPLLLAAAIVREWRTPLELSGAFLRACFDLLVLGVVVFAIAFRSYEPLILQLYSCAWATVFALLVLMGPGLAALLGRRTTRALDIVTFNVCLLLMLGEGGLQLLARVRPYQLLALPWRNSEEFIESNRPRAGALRFGFPHDSRGHYDEELTPGDTRRLVVTIGDSFSYSSVPHRWHYTTVCERLIPGLRVQNLGFPSIGPPEYLLLSTREALPLEPELVVIAVFVGNDVAFEGRERRRHASWLQAVFDRDQLMLANVPSRVIAVLRERRAKRSEEPGRAALELSADERSDDPVELEARFPWLADPLRESASLSLESFRATELARAAELCASGPDFYAPFFDVLEEIVRYAGTTKFALLLIPDEFQVEDELWRTMVAGLPEFELERDRAQRLIGAWLEARGIPYEDLLPRLRALAPLADGRRHAYLLRDTHFNGRGNQVAAEGLAALVERLRH